MPPDNELVVAYRAGDMKAMETLVKRHMKAVYNFVRRFVGDEYAEDVTQETFVKVWRYVNRFDEKKNFRVWLFTIARRQAIDYTRKRKALSLSAMEEDDAIPAIEDDAPLPHELFERKEISETLEKVMRELPADRRAIVMLHDIEELTFDEIATIMKKPMNTIKSQYRRALLLLRDILTQRAPK